MNRPIIGLTLDCEDEGGYASLPWYALRRNYCDAVAEAGGLPMALPHRNELADHYLDAIDGLVVTGGAFDIDPALFGAAPHPTSSPKRGRTAFELALVKRAIARDLPLLGICGGEQLIAVALGGTLVQHIPDEVKGALVHEQPNPRHEPGHTVTLAPGSRLAAIAGRHELRVNSTHHQAVGVVPAPAIINAVAADGVAEGVEDVTRRFCIGVQWHPEYHVDPADERLFAAFIGACRS